MINLKKKFDDIYFILCPRTNSFGGVFELYLGLKFARFQKKKIILAVPLLNIHPKHKKKRIFGIHLIKLIFIKLDLLSKILSIVFTIILNINLILNKLKILIIFDKIFFQNKKRIFKFFSNHFGFYFPRHSFQNYFKNTEKLKKNIDWNNMHKITNERFLPNIKKINKKIIVFIKDSNYHNLVAQGSVGAVSDIENYKDSFKLLLKSGYSLERAGDKTQKDFVFNDNNYQDSTKKHYTLEKQYHNYLESEYYFGNGGSTLSIAGYFNIPRAISNASFEYLWDPTDYFSKQDIIIFKKIFSKSHKKILSFNEIFNLDLEYLTNKDNFILIENNQDELFKFTNVFVDKIKNKNNYENFSMSDEFNNLLKVFNKKNSKISPVFEVFSSSYYMIPNFYLKKYLYPNESLEKESLDIKFN